jgi:hypothetical protein
MREELKKFMTIKGKTQELRRSVRVLSGFRKQNVAAITGKVATNEWRPIV